MFLKPTDPRFTAWHVQMMRRRRLARSIWTPAALFAEGQQGVWVEASPTYKGEQVLWQQSDGTVIVDAHGDPVGRNDGLSPNANHLTQSVSADRPLYQTDGSLHWLGFDGAGDYLRSNDFGLPHLHSVAVAFYPTANNQFILDGLTTNSGSLWVSNLSGSEGKLRAYAGSALLSSAVVNFNAWNIATAIFDGANSELRLNGVSVAGDTGTSSSGGVTLGMNGGLTSDTWLNGRISGTILREGRFTQSEIKNVESYLNDLVGGDVL